MAQQWDDAKLAAFVAENLNPYTKDPVLGPLVNDKMINQIKESWGDGPEDDFPYWAQMTIEDTFPCPPYFPLGSDHVQDKLISVWRNTRIVQDFLACLI